MFECLALQENIERHHGTACKPRGYIGHVKQIGHRTGESCENENTAIVIPTINQSRELRCINLFILFELIVSLLGIFPKEIMKNADKNCTDDINY